MKKLTIPFLLAITWILSVQGMQRALPAAELNPSNVPADAKWLLYFDVEQILDSKMIEEAREARPNLTQMVRTWFQNQYGIDPRNDLQSVTMFSRSYHSYTGTVILQANYDAQKVLDDIRKNPDVKETQWQDQTLYTVTLAKHRHGARKADKEGHDLSGGKQMTIVLVDDTKLLLASSVENAQATLKLLAGDAESLNGSDSGLLSDDWKGAMMYGAAIDLQAIDESDVPMPVLGQHEQITWIFKARDGQLFEHANLVAKSPEVAEQMEQFIQGIVAYERLWAAESEPLKKIIDAVEVSREGNRIMVQWEAESQLVLDALDDLMARYRQWRPLMSKPILEQ